jgi:imidazolonepropionase-like amidohydrolase
VLDLQGRSVLPGLVGMHDHLFYPSARRNFAPMTFSFPRLYLACGVTTIRTTGSIEPYTDLELRKLIEAGKMIGPRMHVTGPYLEGPGTFTPQMHQITSPEDATKTVNFWLDQGVDDFKAYNYLTPDELGAAIKAAHARGAKVTGHLCSIGFREAAALGIDDLEHGLLVDTEFFPWKKPGECAQDPRGTSFLAKLDIGSAPVREMIADLVQRHVAITSTLPVFELFGPGRPPTQQRVLDAMATDARASYVAAKTRIDDDGAKRKDSGEEAPWTGAFRKEMEFEREFAKAGGLLLAGNDPTGNGGVLAGFGDQRGLELLVEAGFTPLEAITIATANGAKYLGESERIGTIAVGKLADLIVVKGDPSTKIEDIENVETVFKGGVGYDSAKLIESVRGCVGIR